MRVVFLRANAINPDSRVEKEMRALSSFGFECLCVGWDRSSDEDRKTTLALSKGREADLHLIGVASAFGSGVKNAPKTLLFNRKLYSWLMSNADAYDVVHACDLDTGLAAEAACRKTGKPYVYDIFDFYSESRLMPDCIKGLVRRLEFRIIARARATIICTEQRTEQLTGSKPRQVIVVENTPEFVPVPKSTAKAPGIRLVYVGVLTGDRYLDRLLDTVDRFDDLFLEIGGFGPLQDEVARRSKANGRITFRGQVPYSQTLRMEGEADVMFALYDPAIANHRLAAPNKYYESLMLGTPLIAVEGTSVADWVSSEQTGVVLPPTFTCDELHAAILRAASENADGSITAKQKDLYRQQHSWELMVERLCKLYRGIEDDVTGGDAQ